MKLFLRLFPRENWPKLRLIFWLIWIAVGLLVTVPQATASLNDARDMAIGWLAVTIVFCLLNRLVRFTHRYRFPENSPSGQTHSTSPKS